MASIPVTLPDNVTRYRVFALASFNALFGCGEGIVATRLPLTLRVDVPAFLYYGDDSSFSGFLFFLFAALLIWTVVILNSRISRSVVAFYYRILQMGQKYSNDQSFYLNVFPGSEPDYARKLLNLDSHNEQLRGLKKIICFWKTVYMKEYLEEKICKKLNLLLKSKDKLIEN